jgi:hypothetical protein
MPIDKPKIIHEKVKELAILYQQTHDPSYFHGIIKRVDYLVCNYINNLEKQFPYYKQIDDQEKYNTALLGIEKAIQTTSVNENDYRIIDRIFAYIKSEFRQQFKNRKEVEYVASEDFYYEDFESIDFEEDLKGTFTNLLLNKIVSDDELKIFVYRVFRGASYPVLGRMFNIPTHVMKSKCKKIISTVIDSGYLSF